MGPIQIIPEISIPLREGETIVIEPGGMLAYQNCAMATHLAAGSVWEKLKNYWVGGELLWRNSFTALNGGGWIALEEQMPGQVKREDLEEGKPALMIRRGAYLASSENVKFETQFLGLSGYFSGKGTAVLRASVPEGKGQVFFHASGCKIQELAVRAESGPVIIDNEMILAYSENLECHLKNPGGTASSLLFSGEGLVCEFRGDGVVYVASGRQTGRDNLVDEAFRQTAMQISGYCVKAAFLAGFVGLGTLAFYHYTGINPVQYAARSIANRFFMEIPSIFKKLFW